MLWALLIKDLVRFRRNPLPWLIFLAVPLCITALVGLAFGPRSSGPEMPRIRFAFVDEDDSLFTRLLRGALSQGQGAESLEPVVLSRSEALREIQEGKLSGALVLPPHFTRNYLSGREAVTLELIKNPAQSIPPAILEELAAALVTGMNALARNLQPELPDWLAVFQGQAGYDQVPELLRRGGERLKAARPFLLPPLVSYSQENRKPSDAPAAKRRGSGLNIFGYLLPGLAAMFLLFLANTAMMDLHREVEGRTLQRFRTVRHGLLPWVGLKVGVGIVMLAICSTFMLGGGSLIFRIHWQHPLALSLLTLGYCFLAAGLLALLTALVPSEQKASTLNTLFGMALGMAGGCTFPIESLPAFMREHVSPALPTYWYVQAVRSLESGGGSSHWALAVAAWMLVSLVFIGVATFLFRRRFEQGAAT